MALAQRELAKGSRIAKTAGLLGLGIGTAHLKRRPRCQALPCRDRIRSHAQRPATWWKVRYRRSGPEAMASSGRAKNPISPIVVLDQRCFSTTCGPVIVVLGGILAARSLFHPIASIVGRTNVSLALSGFATGARGSVTSVRSSLGMPRGLRLSTSCAGLVSSVKASAFATETES